MIQARYTTKCPGCGERIEEGENIGMVDGDWCCEMCVTDNHGETDAEGMLIDDRIDS